jgi:hypothetical protein
MSKADDPPADADSEELTAERVVEKHGREVLEELADEGNTAAEMALDLADERGETQ